MAERQDWSENVARLARELTQQQDLTGTVQRVVDEVADSLGHDISASVSLVRRDGDVETPTATDARAVRADELQYATGQGPCLDAIRKQRTFAVHDLVADDRYPAWSSRVAEETGFSSVLSLQLFVDRGESLGALNLFSPRPHAFDPATRERALVFAAQAAIAVLKAKQEENLRTALTTRSVIGQAQGILMERLKISPDAAFAILSRLSQDSNTRLREVARSLVETGEYAGR